MRCIRSPLRNGLQLNTPDFGVQRDLIVSTRLQRLTRGAMKELTVLDRLAALDTHSVSDALDLLHLPGATCGLRPLWNCPKVVGRASTVQLAPMTGDVTSTPMLTASIDAVTTDDRVLVISGGTEGVSCWGSFVANASKIRKIRATVIDGMGRHIESSEAIGYPVYGRGVTMVSSRGRLVQVASGEPVRMRGVQVCEDDYVIADRNGTVFISADHIHEVLDFGERIARHQGAMLEAVRSGRSVGDMDFEAAIRQPPSAPVSSIRNPKRTSPEDEELVSLFSRSDTAGISDALDKLGIHGQALGIMPLLDYKRVTVGPAFTVRYVPASDPAGSVGDFVDDVAEGDVVVIDNGGRTDCTVWGDIMTQYAGLRGISGTVIDGVCRDVNRAIDDDYPLFTAGRFMRTGKDRVQVAGVNESIGIGTVRVDPRDIVVADANGVVIVPRKRAREVAETALKIEQSESGIRAMIMAGATIGEARERLGYHTLQRKG